MSFPDDVRGVVLRLVELLEDRGTDYMIMGGIAVPIWGIPRATYDVDVTLSVDEAAADLLLHKLVANRPKDLADVQNVLAIQGIPDESYLRDWAGRLGVAGRLDEALERAGL